MQIKSIFNSIENTGNRQGKIIKNVKVAPCNLECSYCGQTHCSKDDEFTVMEVDAILDEVADLGINYVTITGGEPVLQRDLPELVAALLEEGDKVNIETNGSALLEPFENKMTDILSDDELVNNLIYTLDYKCENSGKLGDMVGENIPYLIDNDALQFTVSTTADMDIMKEVIDEYEPTAQIFVIPLNIQPSLIVDYLNMHSIDARLQLPLRSQV